MINLTVTKEAAGTKYPTASNGAISFYCNDMEPERAKDGRLVLHYRSGVIIEIPEGKVGLIYQPEVGPSHSVEFAGGSTFLPSGFKGEVTARFKINTDAIPSLYDKGDEFARVILLDSTTPLELSISIEKEQDTKEVDNSTDSEEADNK